MEAEVEKAKSHAAAHTSQPQDSPLRQFIMTETNNAVRGQRSVESFVELVTTLCKDEDQTFANQNIDLPRIIVDALWVLDTERELYADNSSGVDSGKIQQSLAQIVKETTANGSIPSSLCKSTLSTQLLADARLIANKIMFDKRIIRMKTAMLYKQNKFNLSREETLGFSKLVAEIIANAFDADARQDEKEDVNYDDLIKVVLRNISSLIGSFHLDPNRVLDILLDIFIDQVKYNYKFFIQLLKQSPWIPGSTDNDGDVEMSNGTASQSQTPCPLISHLLGFKLRYYQSPDQKATTPTALYYVSALLIKNGLIRLEDLLPYLGPSDEEWSKEMDQYKEELNATIDAFKPLAAFEGDLEDYANPGVKSTNQKSIEEEETVKEEIAKKAPHDKAMLCNALLSIGDIKNAEILILKSEGICYRYPEIASLIYRLCDAIMEPAYKLYIPPGILKRDEDLARRGELSALIANRRWLSKESGKVDPGTGSEFPDPTIELTFNVAEDNLFHPKKRNNKIKFFFSEWADQLDKCTSHQHIIDKLLPIMRLAGYNNHLDPRFTKRLMALGRALLSRENEIAGIKAQWINIARECFLPAVSMSNCNPATSMLFWEFLDLLSLPERFSIYGYWQNDFYKKSLELKTLKTKMEKDTKGLVGKIGSLTVKPSGRQIGRLAHSNPTVVFEVIIDSIQRMDNLAFFIADACRYLQSLSYEVLTYLLIEKLTGSQGAGKMKKKKLKDDGINNEDWLKALSVFAGLLYKKQSIDPSPLFTYLLCQLKDGLHSEENMVSTRKHQSAWENLIILTEFITKILGIEILGTTVTNYQVTATGCGPTVKAEAFQPLSPDHRKASKRTLSRFKEALTRNNMAVQLVALIAQLRQRCIFDKRVERDRLNTNLLGSMYDSVHEAFLQICEMLVTTFEGKEYAEMMPPIDVLYDEYKLNMDVGMHILRPALRQAVVEYDSANETTEEEHPALAPLTVKVIEIMPENMFNSITAQFFTTFWQLSLYDISVPTEHYKAAIQKQRDAMAQSSQLSHREAAKVEAKAKDRIAAIQAELAQHEKDFDTTVVRLKREQKHWFRSSSNRAAIIGDILQYCLHPRSVMSEGDAVFCAKFVAMMHKLGVWNFSSLTLYDKIMSENVAIAISTFTDHETTIHAHFIEKVFQKMTEWHKNEDVYVKKAQGDNLIGFQKVWTPQSGGQVVSKDDLLSHADFGKVMYKWHSKTNAAVQQGLASGEAQQMRNSFLILKQFSSFFPRMKAHGEALVAELQKIVSTEKRDNLKTLAISHLGQLEKNRPTWISNDNFMSISKGLDPNAKAKEMAVEGAASPLPPPNRDLLSPNARMQSPRASPKHPSTSSSSSRAPSPRRNGSHSRPQSPGGRNAKRGREPEIELPPKRVRDDDAADKEKERAKDRSRTRERERGDRRPERESRDRENNKRGTESDTSSQIPNKRSKEVAESESANKRSRTTPNRSEQTGHHTPEPSKTDNGVDRKLSRSSSEHSKNARTNRDRDREREHAKPDRDAHAAPREKEPARDAGRDAGRDTGRDTGRDAGRDAGRDTGRDAARDGGRDRSDRDKDRNRPPAREREKDRNAPNSRDRRRHDDRDHRRRR